MSTTATLYGNWRRKADAKRMHLYRAGLPVCGAKVAEVATIRVRAGSGKLADLCYGCLVYGASGR